MPDNSVYDIGIIGGGLAGLCLALQAVNTGYRVILFEKEEYPFHKVCGEYISFESRDFLLRLGVPLNDWNLPAIHTLQTSDTKGKMYEFELPLGGFGVSRFRLDSYLYQLAVKAGVTVLTGTKVMDAILKNDVFNIQTGSAVYQAKVVAGCYGKRSNLDIKWQRGFAEKKAGALQNFVGIKYHVKYPHAADTIALHNFKDGYCGLSKVEDDTSCLCYLTTAKNLVDSNNSIAQMEERVLGDNPVLKHVFANATFLYDRPLTISQVSFSPKSQVENNALMLGDAAGLITPLCGNGMSMAMHASLLAMNAANEYLQKRMTRSEMEKRYTETWRQEFAKRLWIGRRVQHLFGGETTTSLFLHSMKMLPAVARLVIRSTHGRSF